MLGDLPRAALVWGIVGSLVVYAAVAVHQQRWPSVAAAAIVAVLLAWSHRRARFAAYVFFTAVAIRGALTGIWALPLYAAAVVIAMQTAPARRAWPRLLRGRLFGGDGRMRRS